MNEKSQFSVLKRDNLMLLKLRTRLFWSQICVCYFDVCHFSFRSVTRQLKVSTYLTFKLFFRRNKTPKHLLRICCDLHSPENV